MYTKTEVENDKLEIQDYYSSLLLNQYLKPKAIATIKTLAEAGFIDNLIKQIDCAFDLDSAIGKQLDVLGEYIGLDREVPYQIPRPYFEYDDYEIPNINALGFTDYENTDQNSDTVFYLYIFANQDTQILSDDEYRPLLLLKAGLNSLDHTTQSISDFLFVFFEGGVTYFDNQNMTITYYILPQFSRIVDLAYNTKLLPKPMGVRIAQIFAIPNPTQVFAYGNYLLTTNPEEGYNDYDEPLNGLTMINYADSIIG